MDIKQLRDKGAFIKAPPVPVEVTWVHPDPETGEEMTDTFIVHMRRVSVGWMERVFTLDRLPGDHSRMAATISEGMRFGDGGTEKLSYEDACQLDFGLAKALLRAFNKFTEEEEAKNSRPPTSSGTS